jgi:hypothetical protein
MRGVIGLTVFNVVIVGVTALAFVYGYNNYFAGRSVAGINLGRA